MVLTKEFLASLAKTLFEVAVASGRGFDVKCFELMSVIYDQPDLMRDVFSQFVQEVLTGTG